MAGELTVVPFEKTRADVLTVLGSADSSALTPEQLRNILAVCSFSPLTEAFPEPFDGWDGTDPVSYIGQPLFNRVIPHPVAIHRVKTRTEQVLHRVSTLGE